MTLFRPCIDLHDGAVKQIVGGTLRDAAPSTLKTNFVAQHDAAWYAKLYRQDRLSGAHVIKLGPGNDAAAKAALAAWPGGLQIGGGITDANAKEWLDAGASHVIVTSWLVEHGAMSLERAKRLADLVGAHKIVIDLSCRRQGQGWNVAADRWQTILKTPINAGVLASFAPYCAEFLVHAADVEGLCQGIDEDLVTALATWSPLPVTYAGGGKDFSDLQRVERLSAGKVDLTFGSALDLFGGTGVEYAACVEWNRQKKLGESGLPDSPRRIKS
jgi:phosphoribosylformimino-5-aminoimidazole carboxamide ribotide isomerase